jgi:hypothetical protein
VKPANGAGAAGKAAIRGAYFGIVEKFVASVKAIRDELAEQHSDISAAIARAAEIGGNERRESAAPQGIHQLVEMMKDPKSDFEANGRKAKAIVATLKDHQGGNTDLDQIGKNREEPTSESPAKEEPEKAEPRKLPPKKEAPATAANTELKNLEQPAPSQPAAHADLPIKPEVRVLLTMDWEGMHITEENLKALREFRQRNPSVRMVHFIDPSYFLRPGVDAEAVRKQMNSVILPGDEVGLHTHGWEALVKSAGVRYKNGPTYEGQKAAVVQFGDRGHSVPISKYSEAELRKIVRRGLEILKEQGFTNVKSFRAGGWLGSPNVLAALVAEGIHIDSSGLPADLDYDHRLPALKNLQILRGLAAEAQPNTKVTTQPYQIQTPHGVMEEHPNTAGMADYVSKEGMVSMFLRNFKEMLRTRAPGMYFNMGLHQETAAAHLGKIEAALREITAIVDKRNNMSIHSVGLTESVETPLRSGKVMDCRTLWESLKGI